MKYYCRHSPDKKEVEVFSEEEILNMYYDYWYSKMCEKYGKEKVDESFCRLDCIDDWITVNWAWESD
jgi:hypothetical protein